MGWNYQLSILFLAGLVAGCSSSAPPPGVLDQGPHKGFLRPLPGGAGFVEIVTEPAKNRSAKAPGAQLSVYFLAPDRTTALSPVPRDVSMDVVWSDSSPRQTVVLSSMPEPNDPAGAAKFVSAPGAYDSSFSGTMTLKLGDKTISAAF
jgi:hypothetical protein